MKSVIKALLAASMLMPIAAQAQEQDGRERGQGRRGAWAERADRPQRAAEVGVEAQVRTERPQRAEFRAERGQDAQDSLRDTSRRDRDRNGPDGDRAPGTQRDWGDDRQARRPQGEDRRWNGNGNGDGGRGQVADGRQRGDRDGPGQFRPGARDDRQGDRRSGYTQGFVPGRGGWRGNDGRDWNDGRRYDNRAGTWNRGWRNDSRYDWSRNRQVNRSAYRLPRYYAPSGWGQGYRRFSPGVSLSSILFSRNYWIDDPYAYRLPEAYGPYRWVRYYDDALLVDVRSGQVVDTVYDIFF